MNNFSIKNTLFFSVTIITLFLSETFSQDSVLYIPRNIKNAYNKGTRSYDGKPGPNYWQNFADYSIKAKIDTSTRTIIGEENIIYHNNSPDSLKQIVFRLYQNVYKKGEERDFKIETTDLTDGMRIEELKINGVSIEDSIDVRYNISGTIMSVKLDTLLYPRTTLDIFCEWSFIMPLKTDNRMGMIDSTSYYVGYWYPQISVYDDIDGWDIFPYTGEQEFYNNFGDFDVEIEVPKNYIVWATGILQNPDQVLTEKYLNKKKEAESSDSVVHIITFNDLNDGGITSNNKMNKWHFKAEDVTDFAFATSDHYLWDAASVVVDDESGRRTVISAAYRNKANDFRDVTKIGIESAAYYSKKIPGVPFPYPQITVVNGTLNGGMEYPMIINDYSDTIPVFTTIVTAHEIAHTYFPFYMGINETKYAWIDEGWATALSTWFISYDSVKIWIANSYNKFAGEELEMPMMIPSILLKGSSYGVASYVRPAESYFILRDMLGDKLFTTTLQEFINRWHGKHPVPYDFFYSFNNVLNENLDWFWKPWFFEQGEPDLAIQKVIADRNKIKVFIKKIGNIPVPVKITFYYFDGTKDSTYQTAAVWEKGNREYVVEFYSSKKINRIVLGDDLIPDIDKKNNIYLIKEIENNIADPR